MQLPRVGRGGARGRARAFRRGLSGVRGGLRGRHGCAGRWRRAGALRQPAAVAPAGGAGLPSPAAGTGRPRFPGDAAGVRGGGGEHRARATARADHAPRGRLARPAPGTGRSVARAAGRGSGAGGGSGARQGVESGLRRASPPGVGDRVRRFQLRAGFSRASPDAGADRTGRAGVVRRLAGARGRGRRMRPPSACTARSGRTAPIAATSSSSPQTWRRACSICRCLRTPRRPIISRWCWRWRTERPRQRAERAAAFRRAAAAR